MRTDVCRSRRLATASALIACTLPAAGCGSSATHANRAASRAATARTSTTLTATHSSVTVTSAPTAGPARSKAAAIAFVHDVTLRAADLPGFVAKHERESKVEKQSDAQTMNRCLGTHLPTHGLAEASSATFEREAHSPEVESIQSSAQVADNETIATRELAAFAGPSAGNCLARSLTAGLTSGMTKGASLEKISTLSFTPPAPGMSGSLGWRITAPVRDHGITFALHLTFVGFQDRQGMVTLLTMGVPEPVRRLTRQRLFSLLLERANTITP